MDYLLALAIASTIIDAEMGKSVGKRLKKNLNKILSFCFSAVYFFYKLSGQFGKTINCFIKINNLSKLPFMIKAK